MLKSLSQNPTKYTIASFCRGLCSSLPIGAFQYLKKYKMQGFYPGNAFGRLIGGNLSVIAAMCGTPYELKAIIPSYF